MKANFIGNSAKGYGGAVYASAPISEIVGNYIGNESTTSYGGALGLHDYGAGVTSVEGNFTSNKANLGGGAIWIAKNSKTIANIENIK